MRKRTISILKAIAFSVIVVTMLASCMSMRGPATVYYGTSKGGAGQSYIRLVDNLSITAIDGKAFAAKPGSLVFLPPGTHDIAVKFYRISGSYYSSAEYVYLGIDFQADSGFKLWFVESGLFISFKSTSYKLRAMTRISSDLGVKIDCSASVKVFADREGRFIVIDKGSATILDQDSWKPARSVSLGGKDASDAYYDQSTDSIAISFAGGGAVVLECATLSVKETIPGIPSIKLSAGKGGERLGITDDGHLCIIKGMYTINKLGALPGDFTRASAGPKAVAFLSKKLIKVFDYEGDLIREIPYAEKDGYYTDVSFNSNGNYLVVCKFHQAAECFSGEVFGTSLSLASIAKMKKDEISPYAVYFAGTGDSVYASFPIGLSTDLSLLVFDTPEKSATFGLDCEYEDVGEVLNIEVSSLGTYDTHVSALVIGADNKSVLMVVKDMFGCTLRGYKLP